MTEGAELIDAEEAASIAGVPEDRIGPMVEEGLLTEERSLGGEPRYRRSEVEALGLLGG